MAILAATGVVLGAIYMLWMVQRVFFGKLSNEANRNLPDLSWREVIVLLPLVIFMFVLGVHPQMVLDRIEPSIAHTLAPLETMTGPLEDGAHQAGLQGAAGTGAVVSGLRLTSEAEDLR